MEDKKERPVFRATSTEINRRIAIGDVIFDIRLSTHRQVSNDEFEELEKILSSSMDNLMKVFDPDYPRMDENIIPPDRLRKVLAESYESYRRSLEHSLRGSSSETQQEHHK